jgi:periplasmic protein TonB
MHSSSNNQTAVSKFYSSFLKLFNMKSDAILNADIIDIIFENRNKEYGAYSLRKFYNNRLYKALGLTFTFVAVLLAFSFVEKKYTPKIEYIDVVVGKLPPPVADIPKPVKPKEKATPPAAASPHIKPPTQIFTNHITITSDEKIPTIKDLNDDIQIGSEDIKGKTGAPSFVTPKGSEGPVTNGDPQPVKPVVDKATPTNSPEVMPLYPGGIDALRKFLERNLKNPQDMDEGQHVNVKIRFIVGYDGTLKGFETVEDGGAVFNNEVIRVLKKMPQWIPGKTQGENVSVYYTIPVNFQSAE